MSDIFPDQRSAGIASLELIGVGESFNDELCAMFEQARIFSELSRNEVEILARYAQAYAAKKGATIFHEGAKGDSLYVVVSGRVDLYKEAGPKNYKKIHTVRVGKTMGEMSLLDSLPYSASAVAAEPSKLLLFTKFRFQLFTEEQPSIAVKVISSIARLMSLRLRQTTGILLDYLE